VHAGTGAPTLTRLQAHALLDQDPLQTTQLITHPDTSTVDQIAETLYEPIGSLEEWDIVTRRCVGPWVRGSVGPWVRGSVEDESACSLAAQAPCLTSPSYPPASVNDSFQVFNSSLLRTSSVTSHLATFFMFGCGLKVMGDLWRFYSTQSFASSMMQVEGIAIFVVSQRRDGHNETHYTRGA